MQQKFNTKLTNTCSLKVTMMPQLNVVTHNETIDYVVGAMQFTPTIVDNTRVQLHALVSFIRL